MCALDLAQRQSPLASPAGFRVFRQNHRHCLYVRTHLKAALFVILALCITTGPARADPAADALRSGGVALLMRHTTAPGTWDPDNFKLNDCATQRNLSAEGRDEARRIGAHLKKLGLVPGEVLTSQWCRCRDTAALAFGGGRDWPALNSFAQDRERETRQVAEVLARIARVKPGDKPLVLVTHQMIITAVSGVFPQSGEVVMVAPAAGGGKSGVTVIGSIKPEAAK
jgi:phosphohistidine phosphatase SixA